MDLSEFQWQQSEDVIGLFRAVFSASAVESEGHLLGHLVTEMLATTAKSDLLGFVASAEGGVIGAIFFSRFILATDKVAFLLSPVAVATDSQGQGVGQQLINFGLNLLIYVNNVALYRTDLVAKKN